MLEAKKSGRAPAAGKPAPAAKVPAILNPAAAAPAPVVAAIAETVPTPAAIAETIVPPAPAAIEAEPVIPEPVSNPVIEGQKIMATTFETAAANPMEKIQSLFGDPQGQAKAAMEKGAKFYEDLGDFTKGNVEAVMASTKVAASGIETIGQDVAAYSKRSLEHATTTFKSLSAVKSPTDLFQIQSDYAKAAFEAMIAEGSRMSEKMVKLAGEVAQPISTRFAVAAEKLKTPAL